MKLPTIGGQGYGILTLADPRAAALVPQLWREHGDDPSSEAATAAFAAHGIEYQACPNLTKSAAELPEFSPDERWGESLGMGFGSFRE